MTAYDLGILIKKITVGIIIYLIPVFLLIGGLLFTKAVLKKDNTAATSQTIQP